MADISERILGLLKDSGLTIKEVSDKANIHRITAAKYLAIMEAEGFVRCRPVGRAKMYFLNIKKVKEERRF